jgi:hypothetical protein
MSSRALKVGDTIIQITDAVALRDAGNGEVWFLAPAVAVKAKMSMSDALKLMDWKVSQTIQPA